MKTFTDNNGRTWTFSINVSAVKRCRVIVGVDLYGLATDGMSAFVALTADPVKLFDVLWVLCEEEADKRQVGAEDFLRAIAGDAILHATKAFQEELIDFFPDPRVRAGMKKVMAMADRVESRRYEILDAKMTELDPDSIARESIASSGVSLGSSDSTPDRSRSENSTTWSKDEKRPSGTERPSS